MVSRSAIPFLLLCAVAASAQESIHFGSVAGRVLDPSGAAVESAAVSVRHLETNSSFPATTDREGRFRFPYLKIGDYELSVHRDGFTDAKRAFAVRAGAAIDFPIALSVGAAETKVLVSADTTPLETARTQISGSVSRAEAADLPLNGRNFLDLALLVPGVSPTNTASNQLFAETSAVPGQGISVGSQRNFSNNFIVDGLSANDDAAGLSGGFFGLDTVGEFQVVTSGGQAEFGRALGGYINMVTRSGGNRLGGAAYGYLRNQRLNASNPLSNTKLPSTQVQDGASLGGPIVRDRTFFFTNFEQRILNQSGLITIAPANVAAINARLDATGYKGSRISTGLYPNPVHNQNFLAKIDHKVAANDQLNLRYSLYHVDSSNSRGAGALSAASASAGLANTDQTVAVGNVWSISPRTVNETRAQYTRSVLAALPTDGIGPAVSISGVASFGTLSGSPTGRVNNLYEIADNLSHQVGGHALRAGVDFLYNDLAITFPRSVHGSYAFSSLANFLAGTYNSSGYTQTFGNTAVSQTNPNVGFYAQDEWKVTPRLTLNLGVRYDLQFIRTIATDTNNVSPRAGFAWTPFASRRTVVRGGFGLYYDRVPLRAVANALLSSNNTTNLTATTQANISLSPTQAGAPVFPNTLATVPTGVLINFSTMNPNMQNAYSDQGSIEVEHKLTANTSLSAGYQHLRGVRLIVSINQNVPSCAAVGTNNGCRPNPNYANNSQYSPRGDSRYDGLHVSFVQQPTRWGTYRVSYDWSKALDNIGEFFFSAPIDNFNIWQDWGRSDDDQRHRVVVDGTAHLPYGFQFSGMLQYYSSLPFNITVGSNTVQGTAARPTVNGVFIPRNAGGGADLFVTNARLSRTFPVGERAKVMLLFEAFNALNHRNDLTRNGTFGAGAYPSAPSATFGQITAVNDPRSAQVALRLTY